MIQSRRSYTRDFKVKIVKQIEAGDTVASLARRHQLHPNVIYDWVKQYRQNPDKAFRRRKSEANPEAERIAELERKIGQLTMEKNYLKKLMQRLDQN